MKQTRKGSQDNYRYNVRIR